MCDFDEHNKEQSGQTQEPSFEQPSESSSSQKQERQTGPYYGFDPGRYAGKTKDDSNRPVENRYDNGQPPCPPGQGPYRPPYGVPSGGKRPGMTPGAKTFMVVFGSLIVLLVAAFCLYGVLSGKNEPAQTSSRLPSSSFPLVLASSSESGEESEKPTSSSSPVVNELAPTLKLESNGQLLSPLSAKEIAKKVKPSVVGIVTYTLEDGEISVIGQGSGIVMSEDGYIITNSHVVGNSRDYKVRVVTYEEEEYDAVVIGYDTKTDLAAIKVEAMNLSPAEFGDSDALEVGDTVVAIGNPGGLTFAGSVTQGIVSALDRVVVNVSSAIKLIQVDAAINPGNSGGALVNEYGKVIGINSAKLVSTSYEGMGFSIPIKQAKKVIDDLLKNGMVTNRVRIGISCTTVERLAASLYGIPQGLQIVEIPADSALIGTPVQLNDIITHVDGNKVNDLAELYDQLDQHAVGDQVTLTLYRVGEGETGDETFQVKITLLADVSG